LLEKPSRYRQTFKPPALKKYASMALSASPAILRIEAPHNPTGTLYTPEFIEVYYKLAVTRGIALIIHETYKDFRGAGGVNMFWSTCPVPLLVWTRTLISRLPLQVRQPETCPFWWND
jgi:histidinol-phosphate/aromatic aminotransferase/cobyric acid decarboxylase-like protein